MKWMVITVGVIAVGAFVTNAPRSVVAAIGMTIAAVLISRYWREDESSAAANTPAPKDPRPQIADPRIEEAMMQGRREIGLPAGTSNQKIEIYANDCATAIKVGYVGETPFIAQQVIVGEPKEMTFVIRRRRSPLNLAPIVDNTPLETAGFEYRLRTLDVADSCGETYALASNRPRVFRELVRSGVLSDIQATQYHPRFRLEDICYSGNEITLLIHPAADPTQSPYVKDTLDFTGPIVKRLVSFLEHAHIPNSQS